MTHARCNGREVELRADSAVIGRQFISMGAIELKGTHRTRDASLRTRLPRSPSVCETMALFTRPRLGRLAARL